MQSKLLEQRKFKSISQKKVSYHPISQVEVGKNLDSFGKSKLVYPAPSDGGDFESELDAMINNYPLFTHQPHNSLPHTKRSVGMRNIQNTAKHSNRLPKIKSPNSTPLDNDES
jgi:hypothetical protein